MQENKQEKSQIKRNISLYLHKKGVSDYEFYKKSGITRGVLSQPNGISEDNITRFLAYAPDINVEWLLTGEGEMLKTKRTPDEAPSDERPTLNDKGIKFPAENQDKTHRNTPQQEYLINKIVEQAEEIGRLKARIEELERSRGDDAGHARSSGIADVG